MLPRTNQLLVTLSLFVHIAITSPVYNMQPAYITATIGSTGRNIRNLPCISRKSNQSGVCMFAIDCLKANGTHLGTCIDRFYFGSCCHIEPLQDITENTIDAALIPSREPPQRIASTTTIATTTTTTTTTGTTKVDLSTSQQPPAPITTSVKTTSPPSPSPSSSQEILETTESYKITTFQSVDDVPPITTTKPKPSKTKPTNKPVIITLSTTTTTTTATKATKPKPHTTSKPQTTYQANATATKANATSVASAASSRPRPKPTKPVKLTRPTTLNATISSVTPRTTTTSTTARSATTTRKLTKKPSAPAKATTKKPIITVPSALPVTLTTSKPTTATIKTTTKLTTLRPSPSPSPSPSSTLSNEVLLSVENATTVFSAVTGNPATNEIELQNNTVSSSEQPVLSSTTTTVAPPGLVTWSEINKNHSDSFKNVTTSRPVAENGTTLPADWVPITDGWVLLPSLATTLEPTDSTTIVTTIKSEEEEEGSSTTPASIPTTIEGVENGTSTNITSSTASPSTATDGTIQSSATTEIPAMPVATSGINMSDFTDVCGRRMVPEGRIVGGEKSSFGKWPWQISLRQWRTSTYLHKCGAALLNENWAITAAHCVDNVPPSDLLLRLGEHDLSTEAEPYLHQERRVQIVASHPQFDPRTFEYDLALLRFYEPVTFQPNIIPVCVPQTDENFVGRNAYVTGWGRLYEDGPLPSILQEVSVPVINNTVCESMYRSAGYIEHIPNIFICAGWRRGGFDSCEGDSGGPMVIQRPDKRFILAGVISWGIGCAEPNQPGVYTRISEFRDWINQILQF